MTPLEQRYRQVLRLLPAYYRTTWEEDMVIAFMARALPAADAAAADADDVEFAAEHGRPSGSDVAAVAMLAVRLRLGGAGASPRHRAWGAAVRRVALVGFLAQVVLALIVLGSMVAVALLFRALAVPDPDVRATEIVPHVLSMVQVWAKVLWVPAYLALVGGYRRVAGALAVFALVPSAVSLAWASTGPGGLLLLVVQLCWLLVAVVPVLALAAFHSQAPPVRRRPWFVALSAGIALVVAMLLLLPWSLRNTASALLFDPPALACALVCVAGIGCLVAAAARRGGPSAEWSAALALLGVGALAVRVVTLLPFYPWSSTDYGQLHALITAGAVEAGMTFAVTVALVVVARRALRALADPAGAAVPSR